MSSYHITTLNSTFVTSGYAWNLSPFGTVLVDAAAFLIASPTAQDSMSLDSTGSWNVTVNGEVLAEGFHAGIVLGGATPLLSRPSPLAPKARSPAHMPASLQTAW